MNTNGPLLPFVLLAGLLDSINPCAIAVLLIFIALMFTMKKSRRTILIMGATYIASVFVTYLTIGLGILKVFHLFCTPHLLAQITAYLVIAVGVWGFLETIFRFKIRLLAIPLSARQAVAKWAFKATMPAMIVMGFLVGITEFPCSGAIYLATVGLLAGKTFAKGLVYLLLYNFMFILPLVIIFIVANSRMVAEKLLNADETNSSKIRIVSALIMVLIGLAMLIWLV